MTATRSGPDRTGELTARQLAAIDAFNEARRIATEAARAVSASREMRLDATRRLDVLRRQHTALVAATDGALRSSRMLLLDGPGLRSVVVHRAGWFGDRVATALACEGISVLARLENGADAVGAAVAEQPELLVMEDPLPMMTAEQVVREVRRFSPATLVAVQAPDTAERTLLQQAGARYVFGRRDNPVEVAHVLAGMLLGA